MPRYARLRSLLVIGVLLDAGAAFAQQAEKSERCTGGLCDLYYSMNGSDAAQTDPSAKGSETRGGLVNMLRSGQDSQGSGKPPGNGSASPRSAARAGSSGSPDNFTAGGGNGLVGVLSGNSSDGCEGVLCDLYYQGRPHPPANAAAAGPTSVPTAAAAPEAPGTGASAEVASADADAGPSEPLIKYAPPPKCLPTARDPWACAR